MSIFDRLSGLFGNSHQAQVAQVQSELDAANDRIAELESQPPVEIEVPVPQDMVSSILTQFEQKSYAFTMEEYQANVVGLTAREFVRQYYPTADVSKIGELSVTSRTGITTKVPLDSQMPVTLEPNSVIAIAQMAGRGE